MKLTKSSGHNPNYLAKIVKIESFKPHPNADRMKLCVVDGCVISTSIDSQPGVYVYFPVECVINSDFLKHHNLYSKSELNNDSEKKGFFGDKGRVKCIKLRGLASEGLVMPIESIYSFLNIKYDAVESEKLIGVEFDEIDGALFVWKYVIQIPVRSGINGTKQPKKVLNIVEGQFNFHIDTPQLARNLLDVHPNDIIQISSKWHGTSLICSNTITYNNLSFGKQLINKVTKTLFNNPVYPETSYHKFCSSRKVIKDPILNPNVSKGYYDCDIWTIAFEVLKDFLQKGMSFYAEIVGYMPTGSMIQKDYDYGCVYKPEVYDYTQMTPQQMYDAKLFDIIIYRITYTNVDGRVYEWSTQQILEFCNKYGLHGVKELYYGYAHDLFNIPSELHWHEEFLENCKKNFLEKRSVYCNNNVPEEGIVLRREVSDISVYKLKSLSFLQRETAELDKGEADIESIN